MILHIFVYGLLILAVDSEDNNICNTEFVKANHLVEIINQCMDHLFGVCTKAADDIKDIYDAERKKTMKADKCDSATADLDRANSNFVYLMIMERYDFKADYYEYLRGYAYRYIKYNTNHFTVDGNYSALRPIYCPIYTKKACRHLLAFCDEQEYAGLPICAHPSYAPYKEYLRCYFSTSEATSKCAMLCDRAVTEKLFGSEKTDDVRCKTGKDKCEEIDSEALISECEGHFKAKCDVSAPNTYSLCEQAIRSMKLSPQLLASSLENHKCHDIASRLICFEYLKLLGEKKKTAQFVESHCSKQSKPEICNLMEEYCGNSNLQLQNDLPECKRQTEVVTTSTTTILHNQSYQSTTHIILNQKTEQRFSYVLLAAFLFYLFGNSFF